MKNSHDWLTILLKQFPRFVAVIIGIILTTVGGVSVLEIGLKHFVFGIEMAPYVDSVETCEIISKDDKKGSLYESLEDCVKVQEEREKNRHQRTQKQAGVEGLALLLVGIPLWIVFGKNKKKV